jgi:hypothetical protein
MTNNRIHKKLLLENKIKIEIKFNFKNNMNSKVL